MKLEIGQRAQVWVPDPGVWLDGRLQHRECGELYIKLEGHDAVYVVRENEVRPHIDDHPDSKAVDVFAKAMKEKLYVARTRGRSGWDKPSECTVELLAKMLMMETTEGDPVDVANFAMMLFMRKAKPEVLSFAARDFQERMAAPIREELEDIKQLCIEAGCTDPGDEYAVSVMCMVEELRQRTVCTTPYHYLDDVPEADIDAFVAFCKENALDHVFHEAGHDSVWNALSRNIEALL